MGYNIHAGLIDPDDLVVAPSVQYAVNGSSYTLQCEVEEDTALVSWMEPGETQDQREPGQHTIESAALEDEGEYTCVAYFPASDIATQKTVQLYVVGKKLLLSNIAVNSLSLNPVLSPHSSPIHHPSSPSQPSCSHHQPGTYLHY